MAQTKTTLLVRGTRGWGWGDGRGRGRGETGTGRDRDGERCDDEDELDEDYTAVEKQAPRSPKG